MFVIVNPGTLIIAVKAEDTPNLPPGFASISVADAPALSSLLLRQITLGGASPTEHAYYWADAVQSIPPPAPARPAPAPARDLSAELSAALELIRRLQDDVTLLQILK